MECGDLSVGEKSLLRVWNKSNLSEREWKREPKRKFKLMYIYCSGIFISRIWAIDP